LAEKIELVDRGCAFREPVYSRVMYVTVYAAAVRRTNIYLSEAEQAGLDARAAAEGSTRSDVVRAIVDRELNLADEADVDAVLGELAGELAARARVLAGSDPDLRID
jgi:hypothetical protein